jgi:hypothetical protein
VSKARWGMESAPFRASLADTAKQAKQQNNYSLRLEIIVGDFVLT